MREDLLRGDFVYYIRRGDLIKIGHAVDLRARMMQLRPDALLALEVGSLQLESKRHRQFAVDRAIVASNEREWFTPSPALEAHIAALADARPAPCLERVFQAPSLGANRCSFGHAVEGPNAARAKAGGKSCRACTGARSMRGHAARKGVKWDLEQFRAEANRRYAEIMGTAS